MQEDKQRQQFPFESGLSRNMETIDSILGTSVDVQKRDFMLCGNPEHKGICYFLDGMVDSKAIDGILRALVVLGNEINLDPASLRNADAIRTRLMFNASAKLCGNAADRSRTVTSQPAARRPLPAASPPMPPPTTTARPPMRSPYYRCSRPHYGCSLTG